MDLNIPKLDLPAQPTNADLARAIQISLEATAGVHGCLENHVKLTRDTEIVLSGQIKGINDQLNPDIKTSAIAVINQKLDPISNAWATYQRRKKWFLGAVGAIAISVGSSAATGVYNALTTQHIAVQQDAASQTTIDTATSLAKTVPKQYTLQDSQSNWVEQRKVNAELLAYMKAHKKP